MATPPAVRDITKTHTGNHDTEDTSVPPAVREITKTHTQVFMTLRI